MILNISPATGSSIESLNNGFTQTFIKGILLILGVSLPLPAAHSDPKTSDQVTVYFRTDLRNAQSNILTLNGVYDLNTRWGTLETAARVGSFGDQYGLWSYKLEGISPSFWGHHRVAARIVKNSDYPSNVSGQNTRFAERILGSYHPFEMLDLFKDVGVHVDLGTAQNFAAKPGATVLPNMRGSLNLLPIWALKLDIPESGTARSYQLSYSNFDVFDPYYYSYVRYRWDYEVTQFYSLYLAFGATFPN